MADTYESFIGPLHPGFLRPISTDLQKSLRKGAADQAQKRIRATLLISADDFPPSEISTLLELQPSYSVNKGDVYLVVKGTSYQAKSVTWSLDIEQKFILLEEYLQALASLLFGKRERIQKLRENGCSFKLSLKVTDPSPFELRLSPDFLQMLASLQVSVSLVGIPADFDKT